MLPKDKPTGEADVSAAIEEIKMSVAHSCRQTFSRVGQSKVCLLSTFCFLHYVALCFLLKVAEVFEMFLMSVSSTLSF